MTVSQSAIVELAPLREMLRLYCQALTERKVDLQDLRNLVEKNLGWSDSEIATTDGVDIFLPSAVARFETETANFDFLKVMLTQQAGHIEFGSFQFSFHRSATVFNDLRLQIQEPGEYHDHDHGHEGHQERPAVTDLTRFFRMFPSKRLALDIFSVIEGGRIEARVMREYPGIATTYTELRSRALESRSEPTLLPAREALLEFITRVSLGQRGGFKVPSALLEVAGRIYHTLRCVFDVNTSVEDAAEATVRLYPALAAVKNSRLEKTEFADFGKPVDPARQGVGDQRESSSEFKSYSDCGLDMFTLPDLVGREREYLSPQKVDYRGDFRPELSQLLLQFSGNAREQRKALTAEELADLLRSERAPKQRDAEDEREDQDPQISQMVQNLVRELDRRDPRMQSVSRRPSGRVDDDGERLSANQPGTFVYDEWNVFENKFRSSWCKVYEKVMLAGEATFYEDTLWRRRSLLKRIRDQFEQVMPEIYRKEKRLQDGPEHDLDAVVEAVTDLRAGVTPFEKVFWRQHKIDRDVAVAFLLDMSGSTGEAIVRPFDSGPHPGAHRRIIDVEMEAIILMCDALETIGDRYGVYGFSGHGRDNVEFFVIKDLEEAFSMNVAKRFGRVAPLHATRMGPAIRHAATKLKQAQGRARFLFLISDGRPQDRGYSQESSEKEYAVQDTRMAFIEARREGIHPFCLTVDKEGNEYLGKMMGDFSYEVLSDVGLLPIRLPQLYRNLTM